MQAEAEEAELSAIKQARNNNYGILCIATAFVFADYTLFVRIVHQLGTISSICAALLVSRAASLSLGHVSCNCNAFAQLAGGGR
jgi:hypothetical protein